MKNQKGITLVSLVITIIVLIILAGISINILLGDNGIITKAQQAKENTILAQEEELKNLNELYSQLNYIGYSNGSTGDIDNEAIQKLEAFKKTIAEAITEQGIETQETDSAEVMAENIKKLNNTNKPATLSITVSSTNSDANNTEYGKFVFDNTEFQYKYVTQNGTKTAISSGVLTFNWSGYKSAANSYINQTFVFSDI